MRGAIPSRSNGGTIAASVPAGESTSRQRCERRVAGGDELGDLVDRAEGDIGRFQPAHDLFTRNRRQTLLDHFLQRVAVDPPQRRGRESLVASPTPGVHRRVAECFPLRLRLHGEEHRAIGAAVGAVGNDRGVAHAGARRWLPP